MYATYKNEPERIPVEDTTPDIKLPGENEKRIITSEEVEAALIEIQELSTYAGQYTFSRTEDEVRDILGWDILGIATNSITMSCNGIVKVGFDVNDIVIVVDDDSETVYIKLPEVKVLDNYVIWDSVECMEKNNILNPIEFSQYQTIISEIEKEGLEQAKKEGIYDAAREHFRVFAERFLSGMTDYSIVIM